MCINSNTVYVVAINTPYMWTENDAFINICTKLYVIATSCNNTKFIYLRDQIIIFKFYIFETVMLWAYRLRVNLNAFESIGYTSYYVYVSWWAMSMHVQGMAEEVR